MSGLENVLEARCRSILPGGAMLTIDMTKPRWRGVK